MLTGSNAASLGRCSPTSGLADSGVGRSGSARSVSFSASKLAASNFSSSSSDVPAGRSTVESESAKKLSRSRSDSSETGESVVPDASMTVPMALRISRCRAFLMLFVAGPSDVATRSDSASRCHPVKRDEIFVMTSRSSPNSRETLEIESELARCANFGKCGKQTVAPTLGPLTNPIQSDDLCGWESQRMGEQAE